MKNLAATTCEKLLITWDAHCRTSWHPPDSLLGDHFMYQRLHDGLVMAWSAESKEPANQWWQRLRLKNAPFINGPIVLMRLYDAFTAHEFHRGSRSFGNLEVAFFLDYVQLKEEEWQR